MSELQTYHRWDDVPAHLKTVTALGKEGLRPSPDQQPAARIQTKFRSRVNRYDLYDANQAISKRQVSDAQKAALEKAKQAALAKRTCKQCGIRVMLHGRYRERMVNGLCEECQLRNMIEQDHEDGQAWARGVLFDANTVILDTETTGLWNAEIIQIAVIDMRGGVLLSEYLKPQHPERLLEADNRGVRPVDIHGITPEMLADKPSFSDIYPRLQKVTEGKCVLIWNADFDRRLLSEEVQRYNLEPFRASTECAMTRYSAWVGDWSSKYEDYRFQALGGNHDAVGDCRTVIERIKEMADEMDRGPKSAYEEFIEKHTQKDLLDYWQQQAEQNRRVYFEAKTFVERAARAEAWPPKEQERGTYRNILISIPEYMLGNLRASVGLDRDG